VESSSIPFSYRRISTTVFGKHCECIAQKCTHLERPPPLASHLLLPSHCVLTRHGGKKKTFLVFGIRTTDTLEQVSRIYCLNYSHSHTQWVVLYEKVNIPIYLSVKSQLFAEDRKIRLTPKISNHVFTWYFNCTCKSNPVCLIQ